MVQNMVKYQYIDNFYPSRKIVSPMVNRKKIKEWKEALLTLRKRIRKYSEKSEDGVGDL